MGSPCRCHLTRSCTLSEAGDDLVQAISEAATAITSATKGRGWKTRAADLLDDLSLLALNEARDTGDT